MSCSCPDTSAKSLKFDELLNRCMGNHDLVARVLARFDDQFQKELSQLDSALEDKDLDILVGMSHRMKGAAANISAPRLCELAALVEQSARDHDLQAIRSAVQCLHVEWNRFRDAMEDIH